MFNIFKRKPRIGDLVRLSIKPCPRYNDKGEITPYMPECSPFNEIIVMTNHFMDGRVKVVKIIKRDHS